MHEWQRRDHGRVVGEGNHNLNIFYKNYALIKIKTNNKYKNALISIK